uniref:Uncharacterized protein n=1 Tax=Sciurus vulgaris TaxID=55149 RepID=A0A8D2D189_SCIVU
MGDYSMWGHIPVSYDKDEMHPNICTHGAWAHQTIVMLLILKLTKSLQVEPVACFTQFRIRLR